MSGLKYQTLLGESSLDADSIVVENLRAEKGVIGSLDVTKDLYVEGTTEVNEFIAAKASIAELTLPMGASEGYILTSVDATGLAAWKPPNDTLAGDITGPIGANVQAHKWIGNWDMAADYQKFNRVTHNHVEYRALADNVGTPPNTEIGSYSLYNDEYPAPAHSTLAPDSLHQEIALRIEPNQGGFLTHFKFYNISLATVDIKIYTSPGWTVVHEQTSDSPVGLGWQTIELTVPVKVNARQSVLAAMRTNGQPYAYIPQNFDVLLDMDPAVYVGNDATSTETVFWFAKPGHPSSPGNPPMNGGVFNRTYLIDVVYEVGRTWEVVLDARPDTVYEETPQPLRNKTDVDIVDLTVRNSAKFTIQPMSAFEMTPRYLVGVGANKDELRWSNDLDAKQLSCRNTFYYENDGRADAGKVLTCVGNTGACNWEYPTQTNAVTMGGDIMGPSNDAVIKTLAGGTIQVNELLTIHDVPTLPTDLVYENKAQPLRNKTDVDVVTLMVRDSLKLQLPVLNSGVFNLRYLVGWNNPDFNDCKWVNDLYAPIISAQSQLLYPVNAAAGKVLSCVDATGLAAWTDPPNTTVTMAGDVTGTSSASVVNTLAGGTVPVNQLVTLNGTQTLTRKILNDPLNTVFANGLRGGNGWAIPLSGSGPTTNQVLSFNGSFGTWTTPTFPTLGGDVTGTYGATTVNTLAGGTIPVNQLVTLNGEQLIKNKGLAGTIIFSDDTLTRTFRVMFSQTSPYATTMLTPTSTVTRSILLPDASDMLVGENTVNVMKNKTLNDATNTVFANGVRTATWSTTVGGSAPNLGNVFYYNGTNAVWVNPTSLITLAGDVTGPIDNTVAVKATTDFAIGRILNCKNGIQIKKLVVHEGGTAGTINNHDFQGFGTSNLILRYHVNATNNDHVFFAATSASASNELARITGGGDLSVARTISTVNGDRRKKIVIHEEGTATDPNDHRYHGLGTQSFQMRYQVSTSANSHVFYAATSATTSNELARISGVGDLSVARNMSAPNGGMNAQVIRADAWANPTVQGAWMGWNRGGQSYNGQTVFANQQGLGSGGWEWVNYYNNNLQDPAGAPAMFLDKWGSLTLRGNLTVNGEITTNGKSMKCSELDQSYTLSSRAEFGPFRQYVSPSLLFRFTKIGRVVNLTVPTCATFGGINISNCWFEIDDTSLPVEYRPVSNLTGSLAIYNDGIRTTGSWIVDAQGRFTINGASSTGKFNGSGQSGWTGFTATWTAP